MFPSLTVSIDAECKLSTCSGKNYSCLLLPFWWPSKRLKVRTLNMPGTASLYQERMVSAIANKYVRSELSCSFVHDRCNAV